jgi:hypothetical protein
VIVEIATTVAVDSCSGEIPGSTFRTLLFPPSVLMATNGNISNPSNATYRNIRIFLLLDSVTDRFNQTERPLLLLVQSSSLPEIGRDPLARVSYERQLDGEAIWGHTTFHAGW